MGTKGKTWVSSNKGKTYEEIYGSSEKADEVKLKISTSLKKLGIRKVLTEEEELLRREKISRSLKGIGGGYRKGSGRGKSGWYKGYWCDSSWELAWIIYNIEHGISFTRNNEKFDYFYNGKKSLWIPDFILNNGVFVEIKGYFTEQAKEKIKQFPNNIIILGKDEIEPAIRYVVGKYGKNYISLYDNFKNTITGKTRIVKSNVPKTRKNRKVLRFDYCKVCNSQISYGKIFCSKKCTSKLNHIKQVNRVNEFLGKIDKNRLGWVTVLSKHLNVSHTQVRRLIDRHFHENTFYKRKTKII